MMSRYSAKILLAVFAVLMFWIAAVSAQERDGGLNEPETGAARSGAQLRPGLAPGVSGGAGSPVVFAEAGESVCVGGLYERPGCRGYFSQTASARQLILKNSCLQSFDSKENRISGKIYIDGDDSRVIAYADYAVIKTSENITVRSLASLEKLWSLEDKSLAGALADPVFFYGGRMAVFFKGEDGGDKKYKAVCFKIDGGEIVWQSELDGEVLDVTPAGDSLFLTVRNGRERLAALKKSEAAVAAERELINLRASDGKILKRTELGGNSSVRFWDGKLAVCQDDPDSGDFLLNLYDMNFEVLYRKALLKMPVFMEVSPDSGALWIGIADFTDGKELTQISCFPCGQKDGFAEDNYFAYGHLEEAVFYESGVWCFVRGESKFATLYWFNNKNYDYLVDLKGPLENFTGEDFSAFMYGDRLSFVYRNEETGKLELGVFSVSTSELLTWNDDNYPSSRPLLGRNAEIFFTEKSVSALTGKENDRLRYLNTKGMGTWFDTEPLSGEIVGVRVRESGGPAEKAEWYALTDGGKIYRLDAQNGSILQTLQAGPLFDRSKLNNLLGVLFVTGSIGYFIWRARKGEKLFIRSIAGLGALDEAVGRATEMGRPIFYIPGLSDIDETQTMAGLSILGHVSKCTAEYDMPIVVPNCSSVVMVMAQDIVRQAYLQAGNPDSYESDNVCFLSSEQFGFAAGVCGMMVREKPAAVLYMGNFFAEALMLAETGNTAGAVQIAGTAAASQLPFFVAACDYTLMGEELYAASAYLSGEPLQIGSLKGQDAVKAAIMLLIAAGTLLTCFNCHWLDFIWKI